MQQSEIETSAQRRDLYSRERASAATVFFSFSAGLEEWLGFRAIFLISGFTRARELSSR